MYRREGLPYKLLLALCDAIAVALAFGAAYALRFGAPSLFPFEHVPSAGETMVIASLGVVSFLAIFRARGLYALRGPDSRFAELAALLAASLLAFVTLVALTYFLAELRYSRLLLGFFGVFSFLSLALLRPNARAIARALVRRNVQSRRVVILGTGHLAHKVGEALLAHPELCIEIVGFLGGEPEAPHGAPTLQRPVLGPYERIHDVIVNEQIDEAIFAVPLEEHARLPELVDLAAREAIDIKVVPDLYRHVTLAGAVGEFGGLPIIRLQGTPMTEFDRFLKRSMDVLGASLIILFLSPLLLLIALAVRLGSRGPLLYAQERMGIDGHLFKMLKFRTMVPDAERDTGHVWAASDDPRATKVGRWLRKTSLDELPQLFNVLRGDMSLVGPRPERPVFIEEFRARVPRYHLRHMVKAGLTGWAQVNGWRGQTSLERRLEHDLYYIEHWSLVLDLKILLRTLGGGFFDRGAR